MSRSFLLGLGLVVVQGEQFLKLVEQQHGGVAFAAGGVFEAFAVFPEAEVVGRIQGQVIAVVELLEYLAADRLPGVVEPYLDRLHLPFGQQRTYTGLQEGGFAGARFAEQHHHLIEGDEAKEFFFFALAAEKERLLIGGKGMDAGISIFHALAL
jgi:hypothetical protein